MITEAVRSVTFFFPSLHDFKLPTRSALSKRLAGRTEGFQRLVRSKGRLSSHQPRGPRSAGRCRPGAETDTRGSRHKQEKMESKEATLAGAGPPVSGPLPLSSPGHNAPETLPQPLIPHCAASSPKAPHANARGSEVSCVPVTRSARKVGKRAPRYARHGGTSRSSSKRVL